jgi:DEAD/DEAH box helicase domain-containing protein
VLAEVQHPHFQAPALILYDRVPNGVGLAERVFRDHRRLLAAARGVLQRCPCRGGCPSCVGPAGGIGAAGGHGKAVAQAILDGLLAEQR